jgi:hypothetical protein
MTDGEKKIKASAKEKPGYYLTDGTRVPSVSTILNELNKPALVPWANKLGLQGIDVKNYVDALAGIGTLTHDMILSRLRGEEPDASAYSPNQVECAKWCFTSYLAWEKENKLEPVMLETPLVSELYKYGGRSDFLGYVNGKLTLLDFKTGRAIYSEHFIQLSAYSGLVNECRPELGKIEQYKILNIPREESESFDQKTKTSLMAEWGIFQAALKIYNLKKGLER